MTDSPDPLRHSLHRLRREVRDLVPVPAAGRLRTRAIRRLRIRRAATATVAASAVIAVALSAGALIEFTAAPVPPADPTPSSPASPTASPEPPEPSPPPLPEVDFSPRPAPQPMSPAPDDPIAEVEWRQATIDLPPHPGCPSGPVSLTAVSDIYPTGLGPLEGYPQVVVDALDAAYGDVTGDGRIEAVVRGTCLASEEASGDGEGQLLVVAREPDGQLRGVGWVGPRGAIYQEQWVAGGVIYVEAHPWHGAEFDWQPGLVLRYEWTGDGFDGGAPAPPYPPIHPAPGGSAEAGPPVRLGQVGEALGCPAEELRFGPDGTASAGGASFDVRQPALPSSGPHVVDLDHTGDRLLMLALACTRDGFTRHGLAVLAPVDGGYEGVSVLLPPPNRALGMWWFETMPAGAAPGPDRERWLWADLPVSGGDGNPSGFWYRWNGTTFERAEQ